jgi:hypothetical protein
VETFPTVLLALLAIAAAIFLANSSENEAAKVSPAVAKFAAYSLAVTVLFIAIYSVVNILKTLL